MIKKIDIHVHSRPHRDWEMPDGAGDYPTPAQLRKMYDWLGIEKGVELPPGISPERAWETVPNPEACALAARHPETYFWFCNLDLRCGRNSPETDLSRVLIPYKKQGARGVGEVTAALPIGDARVANLFRHCERCGLPVLIRLGSAQSGFGLIDAQGLPGLEAALGQFPNLIFIVGAGNFWSDARSAELLRRYPNLAGDLASDALCARLMSDEAFGCAFLEEFQDSLYFGTGIADVRDILSPRLRLSAFLDELVEKGGISRRAYQRISRENALDLLFDESCEFPKVLSL